MEKKHIKRSETLQSDRYHCRQDYSGQEEVGMCEEGSGSRGSLGIPDGRISDISPVLVPPQSRQVSGWSSRPRAEIFEFVHIVVIGTHFHVYLEILKYTRWTKNCNTFQQQFLKLGKRYELETLTSYRESFDKLFDIHVIITFSKISNSQRHLKKHDLHVFFLICEFARSGHLHAAGTSGDARKS